MTYKRKDIDLQKKVDELTEQLARKETFIDKLKGIIAGLKSKIADLEQKLSSRDSVREQMEHVNNPDLPTIQHRIMIAPFIILIPGDFTGL